LKKRKSIDRHHICPSSKGGSNEKWNIALVDRIKHNLYHQLFKNKTPDEIICYLVGYFWKNQWYWVEIALEKSGKEKR